MLEPLGQHAVKNVIFEDGQLELIFTNGRIMASDRYTVRSGKLRFN